MKSDRILTVIILLSVLLLIIDSSAYANQKIYVKKSELRCGGKIIKIATKCDDLDLSGPPQCSEQILTFIDIKTGKKISTLAYGKPYNKQFNGTGMANAWQCVKGNRNTYITLWYSTGGNCEECDWQAILDMNGNRVASDKDKKNRSAFIRKWKALGLPVLGPYDYMEIPLEKNE